MGTELKDTFLSLVRLGICNTTTVQMPRELDWNAMTELAARQGLLGVVLDGIERLDSDRCPPKTDLLQWIGEVMQYEAQYALQQKAAAEMGLLFHHNNIRTYVLKGLVIAECYPKPEHRFSVDFDCYLLPDKGDFDAWSAGNDVIKGQGYTVNFDYYKNSTFLLPGLMVENHKFMVPFRGNKRLDDKGEDKIEKTCLYRPPVMVSALFLIEHAYSHFLHEGLNWRYVLDWMMFSRKHQKEINWYVFDALIDEFGFRRFYDSYHRLGQYLMGDIPEEQLTKADRKMLADVWAPLDLHETFHGIKGKMELVGNTWRARWKYHFFSEISMLHALWIQVKGFLFIKEPKLG